MPNKTKCKHIWIRTHEDLYGNQELGPIMAEYFHFCPKCGKTKSTLRKIGNALTPEVKLKRRMQKLLEDANISGFRFTQDGLDVSVGSVKIEESK